MVMQLPGKDIRTMTVYGRRKAYSGKALVIVQSTEDAGSFTLTASGAGLSKDAVTVYTTKEEPQEDAVLGYETETMTVEAGILPEELALPATVNAVLANGRKTPVEVSWELPDAEELAEPGELTVRGTADDGTDTAVEMLVVVKGVVGIQEISRVTGLNIKPQLPATVSVVWSDGSKEETSVVWDEIPEEQLAEIGSTFDVKGTVADYPHMEAIAHIRVGEMKEQNVALPSNGGSVSGRLR